MRKSEYSIWLKQQQVNDYLPQVIKTAVSVIEIGANQKLF